MARSGKTKPRRGRRVLRFLLLNLFVVGLAVAGWTAWEQAQRRFFDPHQGFSEARRTVSIAPGTGGGAILRQLEAEGVLADSRIARLYLIHILDDPPLQAGEYEFRGATPGPIVLDKLIKGEVLTYPVTLIEGMTLEETAEHLAAEGFGDREAFLAAMGEPTLIADLDPDAEDLEGYLFPDTYALPGGLSEPEIVELLVRTFKRRFAAEVRPLLDAQGDEARPLRDLVILASVVEKEAQLEDERPIIAAVYANRLERGIALYADPTVIYALKRLGRWNGNIRRPDLRVDSPYNTYVYPGLPPGPIASPGAASMRAAAEPADVPYLYFVSRNDGSHVFSRTLAEHNRNVTIWQKQYWRDRWAKERAAKESGDPESAER